MFIYIMSHDVFVKHINSWVVFITDVRPPNKWKMFSRSPPVHLDPLCRHNHIFNPVRISTAQAQADNISNISNRPILIFLEQIIISNIPWAQVLKLKDFHFLLAWLTIDTTIPIFRIHLCAIFESQNHPEKCNSSLLSSPHRWNFPILVKMLFLPNNISRVLISHAWYQSQCPVIPVLWNLVDHLLQTEILVVVVLSFWAKAVGGCSGEQHFQHGGVSKAFIPGFKSL